MVINDLNDLSFIYIINCLIHLVMILSLIHI